MVRELVQNFSPHDTYFVTCMINAYYYKYTIMSSIRVINNMPE